MIRISILRQLGKDEIFVLIACISDSKSLYNTINDLTNLGRMGLQQI